MKRSLHCAARLLVALAMLSCLACLRPALATETENYGIRVLPTPGKVTVDGKINDWDLTGGIFACGDVERLRDKFSVWVHVMYDAESVYVLARWKDPTPLNHTGSYPGDYGFNADCLQVRFITFEGTPEQGVSWWTCWQDRKGTGVVDLGWPEKRDGITSPVGPKYPNALEHGVQQAFLVDADGKGYTQEIAIPWKLLSASGKALKAGDKMRMTVEPNFTAGEYGRITIKDIFVETGKPDRVFTFRAYKDWGTATLQPKGKVTPQAVHMADGRTFNVSMKDGLPVVNWTDLDKKFEWPGFKKITFTMPYDGYVSLNIYDAQGKVVRQLLTAHPRPKGKCTVMWDGLTMPVYRSPGQPVPTGTYTWKAIVQPGVKLTMRGYASHGGKAPWEARPDCFWGGDHGTPSAIVTDGTRIYMAWNGAEGGRHVQATDFAGNYLWGLKNTTGAPDPDVIAVDNGIVYILHGVEGRPAAIVSRASAKDGSYQAWAGSKSHILTIKDVWANINGGVTGLDAKNGKLYATDGTSLAVLDGGTGKLLKTLTMPGGKFVRAVSDTLVYVTVNNKTIIAVNPMTGITRVVVNDLQSLRCLNVDGDGNIYASLWGEAMQVVVFAPNGKELRRIGRNGGRAPLGPWQADGMFTPYGVAVDKEGKLWVCERDFNPKRISVWNAQTGKFLKEFYGPTRYGASGGAVLPDDPNIMVGEGCEWRIDPATNTHVCTGVVDRADHSFAAFRKGANGVTYLYTGIGSYGSGGMRIFQRLGEGKYALCAVLRPGAGGTEYWADANGDGQEQAEELQRCDGWLHMAGSNGWSLNLGLDMTLYPYNTKTKRLDEVKLAGFTASGAPRFDLSAMRELPAAFANGYQANYGCAVPDATGTRLLVNLATGSKERAGDFAWTCFDLATGEQMWSYPNPWFQVHGSHSAPAPDPGLFRGAYGPVGIGNIPVAGTVWAINCNLGEWHMLTGDGFYLTPLFSGDPFQWIWPEKAVFGADLTNVPPGSGGEDFGGSMTQGTDGKLYVQSGKMGLWNILIENLDKLVGIRGGKITISKTDAVTAASFRDKALQATSLDKKYTVKRMTPTFTGNINTDFAGCQILDYQKIAASKVRSVLAYDNKNLYLAWDVRDTTPWVNGSGDISQIYVGGDTVDLQLSADAKKHSKAAIGDQRLAIGPFQGKPTAVIYKFISDEKKPRLFTSGVVRNYQVDYVDVVATANLKINVIPGQGYIVEATIPWSVLGITPAAGLPLRGDLGVTHGDSAGERTRLRTYWSNQATGLVDDVVMELQPDPANWGEITLE